MKLDALQSLGLVTVSKTVIVWSSEWSLHQGLCGTAGYSSQELG